MKYLEVASIVSCIGVTAADAAAFGAKRSVNLDIENIQKHKLMEKARPKNYEQNGAIRNLQDYSISGQSSIVFTGCANLAVEAYGDSDTVKGFMDSGMAQGVKSYVEFDVCETESCWSGDGSRTSYVVDLADYISAFGTFLPTKQEEYCEACLTYIDYCQLTEHDYYHENQQAYQEWVQYWSDENTQQRQQDQEQNGGQRHRRMQDGVVYEEIDCNRCNMYNCIMKQSDNQYYQTSMQWSQEHSLNFIESMASCYRDDENPIMIDGTQGSLGFVCNAAGTGVEIGVFLDDDCTIFANQLPFGSIMTGQEHYFWQQTKSSIEYIFDTSFSCYNPNVQYVTADEMANYAQGDSYQGNNGDVTEAGEWCTNVFDGEVAPVAMSSCNATYADAGSNGTTYTLSQDDADDPYAACSALVAKGGLGDMVYPDGYSTSMYRYNNPGLYNRYSNTGSSGGGGFWSGWFGGNSGSGSGSSSGSSSNWQNDLDNMQYSNNAQSSQYRNGKSSNGLSGLAIALIVIAVVIVGVAGGIGCFKWYKNSNFAQDKKEPMLDISDDEKNSGWTKVGRIA